MIKEFLQSGLRLHNEVAALLQLPETFRMFQKSMERAMATVQQELDALRVQEKSTSDAVKAGWVQHAADLATVNTKLAAVQSALEQALTNNGQLSDAQAQQFTDVISDLKGLQTAAEVKAEDPTSPATPVVSPGDTTNGASTPTSGDTTASSGSASVSGGGDATVQVDQNQP